MPPRRWAPIDPPLTTRECADWMGVPTDFIRGAIEDGQLEAEDVVINGRRIIRIHLDCFIAYLRAIGWRHLPRPPRQ
jgi:excisionase family DNA binding protein